MADRTRRGAPDLLALISAAFLIGAPMLKAAEGKRNNAYRDPVSIWTVCWGHTGNDIQHRRYSDSECEAILRRDYSAHAVGVAQCLPITAAPSIFASSVDFAFNAGVRRFCTSSMARAFNAGRWTEGCKAFGLYKFAGGRVLPGLVKRRAAETQLCLRGLA